jgi:hypothetical protein
MPKALPVLQLNQPGYLAKVGILKHLKSANVQTFNLISSQALDELCEDAIASPSYHSSRSESRELAHQNDVV